MRKALLGTVCSFVLVACGGGGGGGPSFKDPGSYNPAFSAFQDPTYLEGEAALDGASNVNDAYAIQGEPDDYTAQLYSQNVAALPITMGGAVGGAGLPAATSALRANQMVTRRAAAYLAGDVAAATDGWDNPNCWSVYGTATTGEIKFNNCTVTMIEGTETLSITIDGSFKREDGIVSWDSLTTMRMTATDVDGTYRISESVHLYGDITFDWIGQTIIGSATADASVSASFPGMNVSGSVTFNTDLDLGYTSDPAFCVDSGTITVKRLWGDVPSVPGAEPAEFANAAVQFNWLGCGLVQVAYSVN